MIIWLSCDWMLCSRERGRTVHVLAGDVNKAFIVEIEWVASKGMTRFLLGKACCQMKNKQGWKRDERLSSQALPSGLGWVAQHEFLPCKLEMSKWATETSSASTTSETMLPNNYFLVFARIPFDGCHFCSNCFWCLPDVYSEASNMLGNTLWTEAPLKWRLKVCSPLETLLKGADRTCSYKVRLQLHRLNKHHCPTELKGIWFPILLHQHPFQAWQ